MVKRLTCKKLKELIKDENMAVKEYKELGFNNLSKDEKKHKDFLEKEFKRRKCQR